MTTNTNPTTLNNNWIYSNLTTARQNYVDAVLKFADLIHLNCDKDSFTRTELRAISTAYKGKRWIPNWITHDAARRAGRGEFYLPEVREEYLAQNPAPAEASVEDDAFVALAQEISEEMAEINTV
jgi:hypothetical protein